MRTRRAARERGAASLLVVSLAGLLLLLGAALSVVGAVFVAHRSAQGAADLAALAGAASVADGGDGCASAASVAAANGADLTGCAVSGWEVRVDVRVPGPRWLVLDRDLVAEARAGPAP